jgi:hypothetical protein
MEQSMMPTKLLVEVLLNNDSVLIATARANYLKQLVYLPNSEWKRRLIEMNEKGSSNA